MRGTGALFAGLGALAVAALVIGSDLPAAARSIGFPPPGGSSLPKVSSETFDAATAALGTGGLTLGGPGTFVGTSNEQSLVYEASTGAPLDVCVTVRNLSNADVQVLATGAPGVQVRLNLTRTACYAAPAQVSLRCDGGACAAVWRVDRQ